MKNLQPSESSFKAEVVTLEHLTVTESTRLIQLEKVVTAGLKSWIEVGEALIEIRDSRLYKIEAKTFEEYCQTKFNMSRQHANRLIAHSPIARILEPVGSIPETAVRELAKVEPSKRQDVFTKATEEAGGHIPTARQIKQVVDLGEVEESNSPAFTKLKIINKGLSHWREAKTALDKILQHDLSREDALREAIAYANERLEANK